MVILLKTFLPEIAFLYLAQDTKSIIIVKKIVITIDQTIKILRFGFVFCVRYNSQLGEFGGKYPEVE